MSALLLAFSAAPARADGEEAAPAPAPAPAAPAPPPQPADDALVECLASHARGQELRHRNQLLESRSAFQACTRDTCPGPVIQECVDFLSQLARQIPSVGLRASADGESRGDVRVYVDGKLVLERLTGIALELNPGTHQIRAELDGFPPFEDQMVVNEGDQFRMVDLTFRSAAAMAPAPGVIEMQRPIPLASYIFAGVSVAAALNATGWALSSWSLRQELEQACAPGCRKESIDVLRQRATIADISWGVSAAALITAATVYFLRPEEPVERPVELDVGWLPSGGAVGTVSFHAF